MQPTIWKVAGISATITAGPGNGWHHRNPMANFAIRLALKLQAATNIRIVDTGSSRIPTGITAL